MESIPDVQVATRPTTGSSSGGGGGASKVWAITGQVRVRESEIDGDSHDRPLKGIEVKVSASDIGADGPWTEWGTVRTDADGDFAVSETNNGKSRFFRVQARLYGVDLVAGVAPSRPVGIVVSYRVRASEHACRTGVRPPAARSPGPDSPDAAGCDVGD